MKKLFLISMLTLIFGQSYSQDLIVTSKGDSLNCKITKLKPDYVYFSFNNNGNVASSLLPTADVTNYTYGYYNTGDNASLSGASLADYRKFALSLDFGYSRRLAKTTENASSDYKDYINHLKNGYHFGGDLAYYFSEIYGFGAKFQIFKASNSGTFYVENYGRANIEDNITIPFIGPMFFMRYNIDDKKAFLINYAVGYFGYTDKWKVGNNTGKNTGATAGMMCDFNYNYWFTQNAAFDIHLSLIAGSLSKYTYDDGKTKKEIKLDKEEYEGLGRLDISIGLRFGGK